MSLRRTSARSFTLVEILVAVAVLALIVLVAARLVAVTSHTIVADGKKLDALSQTRAALDRFGLDWNARVARPDVALGFVKQAGNDAVSLIGQMPAPTGSRSLAVIGYRINGGFSSGGSNYRLERGARGFDWSGANPISFPISAPPALADADYQPLAAAIFRLEVCFLGIATPTNAAVLVPAPPANPLSTVTNYVAVLVAVAALDGASRQLVGSAQMGQLVAALPDPTPAQPDPAAAWKAALARPTFASDAGVPQAVASAVRVDERYFYVNLVP